MKNQCAFTLIELSIVLVIIGLIVGGVLVGQDLIKAAEMRSIQDDWSKFEAARHTFRLKYNCLPGDCPNAATFGLGTNGDGDKIIDHPTTNQDNFRYWSHLASAGLIEGSYTGTQGSGGTDDADIGSNVPASKRSGVGYSIYQRQPVASSWSNNFGVTESMNTHFLVTGKEFSTVPVRLTFQAAFTVEEAFGFDQKFDDGLANDGKIRTHNNVAGYDITCATGAAPNYSYNVSGGGMCGLMYLFNPR